MPPKRKQPDGESRTNSSLSTPAKKVKPNPTPTFEGTAKISPKRKQPPDDIKTSSSAGHKKLKPTLEQLPTVTSSVSSARVKETSPSSASSKSTLVPRGVRKKAIVGQKDDSLLRMLCDNSKSGELKELHFRKIPHSLIDWNNPKHILDINNWRNQIYGRAGFKAKAVTMWHEEEELWFELYFQLSIAESRARGFLLPKTKAVLDAFNENFAGRVLTDKDGNEREARTERQHSAFASKFNRMCPQLRERLQQCVFGKSGDVFVPQITPVMLHRYKRMKAEMAEKGITEESAYSENLQDWQHFLSHLPHVDDVIVQTTAEQAAAATVKTEEDNAAAALVRMANYAVHWPMTVSYEGSDISKSAFDYDKENTTPKAWQASPYASSQSSDDPHTTVRRTQVLGRYTEILDEDTSLWKIRGPTNALSAAADDEKFARGHYSNTPGMRTTKKDLHYEDVENTPQYGS